MAQQLVDSIPDSIGFLLPWSVGPVVELDGFSAVATRLIPGRPCPAGEGDPGQLRNLLNSVSSIATEPLEGLLTEPLAFCGGSDWYRIQCEEVLPRLDREVRGRAADAVSALANLEPVREVFAHGDLGGHNVFWEGNRIVGVLDWDLASRSDRSTDLACIGVWNGWDKLPLIAGAATVLYEGKPVGTPDAGAFLRVAAEHGVDVLFTAPTALRAIRRADPDAALTAGYDLTRLRTLFAAGERLDPETYRWATESLGIPVVDHWWQTETGWAICANPMGLDAQPLKAGSPTFPVPGFRVRIVDGAGTEVPPGAEGNIVLDLPLPPGTLATLWGSDDRYRASYLEAFEGSYATGDSGYVDEDGYVFVMGRTDDVINVAGHRLSTGAIEQVVASHPAVAECAVIGVRDSLKGQRPCGYVVLKAGSETAEEEIQAALAGLVRTRIGPVADFREVRVVEALPKTRSGKILRKTMRQIADGDDFTVPSTIEDRSVLDDLIPMLRPGT